MNKEKLNTVIRLMLRENLSLSETVFLNDTIKFLNKKDIDYIMSSLQELDEFVSMQETNSFQLKESSESIGKILKKGKDWFSEIANEVFDIKLAFGTRGVESFSDLLIEVSINNLGDNIELIFLPSEELYDKLISEHKTLAININDQLFPMKKDELKYSIVVPDRDEYKIEMIKEDME